MADYQVKLKIIKLEKIKLHKHPAVNWTAQKGELNLQVASKLLHTHYIKFMVYKEQMAKKEWEKHKEREVEGGRKSAEKFFSFEGTKICLNTILSTKLDSLCCSQVERGSLQKTIWKKEEEGVSEWVESWRMSEWMREQKWLDKHIFFFGSTASL